jgi:hypothetical protein
MESVQTQRFNKFYSALVTAQDMRDCMPMRDHETPYWNTYEMLTMWSMVNRMRKWAYDRPPVPYAEVKRVEQMAAGHIDYTKKFALYCSELVDLELDTDRAGMVD